MKTTSIEAYKSILPTLSEMHQKVLTGFIKIKKGTFRDIAKSANLTESQTWKRLSELERQGLIKDESTVKCPSSGRKVTVWELVE